MVLIDRNAERVELICDLVAGELTLQIERLDKSPLSVSFHIGVWTPDLATYTKERQDAVNAHNVIVKEKPTDFLKREEALANIKEVDKRFNVYTRVGRIDCSTVPSQIVGKSSSVLELFEGDERKREFVFNEEDNIAHVTEAIKGFCKELKLKYEN